MGWGWIGIDAEAQRRREIPACAGMTVEKVGMTAEGAEWRLKGLE